MIRRVKTWILRRVAAMVESAAYPAVEGVAQQVLNAVVPAVTEQALRATVPVATQEALDRALPGAMQQMMDRTRESLQENLPPSLGRIDEAGRAAVDAVRSLHADLGAAAAQEHARQRAALSEHAAALFDRTERTVAGQVAFSAGAGALLQQLARERDAAHPGMKPPLDLSGRVRAEVRKHAGLSPQAAAEPGEEDLLVELRFIRTNSALLRPLLELAAGRRVLYAGQSYYHAWYLSRALRDRGWKADVLNSDDDPATQGNYHGEDFQFAGAPDESRRTLQFYVESLYGYDVFHFSSESDSDNRIGFGAALQELLQPVLGERGEVHLLKALGKKIVYSHNGCHDGVSQTMFAQGGPDPACGTRRWPDEPQVCSDERNLAWGRFRNLVSDYQCLPGGNRVDFNDDPRVHDCPWFYCLDARIWRPDLEVPERLRLPARRGRTLRVWHAVGSQSDRAGSADVRLPVVDKLRSEGWDIELISPDGVPNREARFLQLQADVVLEMTGFGWFGASAREAMMLGKPVICFIRPEWLESLAQEVPDYARDLPIVNATPGTVQDVLRDLLASPDKRAEIGRRSREFMLHWHSSEAAARRFEDIYARLIAGDPLYRATEPPAPRNVSGA